MELYNNTIASPSPFFQQTNSIDSSKKEDQPNIALSTNAKVAIAALTVVGIAGMGTLAFLASNAFMQNNNLATIENSLDNANRNIQALNRKIVNLECGIEDRDWLLVRLMIFLPIAFTFGARIAISVGFVPNLFTKK